MNINNGDILVLKKPHPCGGFQFLVKRTGADIGIKCMTCGHYILVPKIKLVKNVKQIVLT